MTGGKKTVQRRIAQLVKQPEPKKAALFLAAAAVALAAVFVFAGGQRGQETVPSGDYSSLRSDIRSAQAIRLGQPLYSSYADPTQITDPDLLAQAKGLLFQARDLMNFSDQMLEMDWQSAFVHARPLALWDAPQDETAFHTYYLWVDRSSGRTYVMDVDPEHFTEESCLPFASFGGNLLEQLEALQQEQRQSSFHPVAFELPIGPDSAVRPLRLTAPGGQQVQPRPIWACRSTTLEPSPLPRYPPGALRRPFPMTATASVPGCPWWFSPLPPTPSTGCPAAGWS